MTLFEDDDDTGFWGRRGDVIEAEGASVIT